MLPNTCIRYYGDKYKNYTLKHLQDNAGVLQRQIFLKDTIKKYYDTYSYMYISTSIYFTQKILQAF